MFPDKWIASERMMAGFTGYMGYIESTDRSYRIYQPDGDYLLGD